MLTSASVIPVPSESSGAASLAEWLFAGARPDSRIIPSGGKGVRCQHCARDAFSVLENTLIITHRHGSQYHQTVVSLAELGLQRIE